MADAHDHADVVLSAILPARKDLLDRALVRLTDEHFPDKTQRKMFQFLRRYHERTGSVLPVRVLSDILRNAPVGQVELFTEEYERYAETAVEDSDFDWSCEQLKDIAAERATGEAITEAMTILRTGKTQDDGEVVQGHEAAREALLTALSTIDREVTMQEAPEGVLNVERDDILADYAERRQAHLDGSTAGVRFGVQAFDAKIDGLQPGELCLVVGYSSDGKSSFAVQTAWSAAVEQGKNVAFLTTETLRAQIRRKLVARHSRREMFGLSEGLNTRDLKAGTLPPAQESVLPAVVDDLTRNPAYGQIYVAQVPRGASITNIEQRLYRIQRQMNVDLVVMDYLALLVSDRHRQTTREELAWIMKESKQISTTFDGGRGIPFISPWQVTRTARENAEKIGMYTSASTSETSEATNTADVLVSLLAPTDNTNRYAEVTGQILKARDGETANGLVLSVDYATCWFSSRNGLQFAAAPQGNGHAVQGFGGLEDLIA